MASKRQQRLLELILGKKAADGMQKGMQDLVAAPPHVRRQQLEADYMRREAVAGQRVMGQKNMQLFCRDPHTWVWHIDGKRPVTMLYHIRPDGVVKQRVGGPLSAVKGSELEHFGQYVQAYYNEVSNTVYRKEPATTVSPASNWAPAN